MVNQLQGTQYILPLFVAGLEHRTLVVECVTALLSSRSVPLLFLAGFA